MPELVGLEWRLLPGTLQTYQSGLALTCGIVNGTEIVHTRKIILYQEGGQEFPTMLEVQCVIGSYARAII
eukprot:6687729-Ditylum_brightwellii.AAC.1